MPSECHSNYPIASRVVLSCSLLKIVSGTDLSGRDLSEERAALDLDEPGVLEGVAAQRPLDLAEHGVAAELEAGEQKVSLRQLVRLLLVGVGDAGSEDDRRQLQLEQRLPVALVHLENDLLDNLKNFRVSLRKQVAFLSKFVSRHNRQFFHQKLVTFVLNVWQHLDLSNKRGVKAPV